MLDLVLSLALPFLVALAVSGVVRLSAGAERGARLLGAGPVAGYLAWWLWDRGPGLEWSTPLSTAPLPVLAGLALGVGLNLRAAEARWPGWLAAVALALFGLWLAAGAPLQPGAVTAAGAPLAGAAVLWAVILGGPGRPREAAVPAVLLLTVAAAGLAGVALGLGLSPHAGAALALAAALPAVLPWLPTTPTPPGWIVVLAGGGAAASLATAVLLAAPAAAAGPLLVLALVFLVEPTAARLPAGGGRLAALARPLWLVLLAALPAALAAFLARVMAQIAAG